MNHLLTINKQKVINNINKARKSKKACLMVKANTYGMGNTGLQMLLDAGYDYFGVSTIEEALNIRSLSPTANVLIVSYVDDIEACIENNFTITVYDFELLNRLDSRINFHLKVDTNMGRLGFQLSELPAVRDYLQLNNLQPEGIFSHLANASIPELTQLAIDNFEQALAIFSDFEFKYIHLLNSFGALNYDTKFDNMVRLGIGTWGYFATTSERELSKVELEPALSLSLTVSHQKMYSGPISYDFIDDVNGSVLTVPIGYHDGFFRRLTHYQIPNVGTIVGKINMCQLLILEEGVSKFKKGDLIPLYGENYEIYNLADFADFTIYEILVLLSNRINRKII